MPDATHHAPDIPPQHAPTPRPTQAPQEAPQEHGHYPRPTEGTDTSAWVRGQPVGLIRGVVDNSSTERGTNAVNIEGWDVEAHIRTLITKPACISSFQRPCPADAVSTGILGPIVGRGPYPSAVRETTPRRRQRRLRRRQRSSAPRSPERNRNPKSRYRSTRIPNTRSAIPHIRFCRGCRGVPRSGPSAPSSSRLNPPPTLQRHPLTPQWCRGRGRGWCA